MPIKPNDGGIGLKPIVGSGSPVAPTLADLTLSTALTNGVSVSGSILGATAGSTIVITLTGLTVNSAARTYTFDGTATAGSTATPIETLAGATNSPHSSPPITVASGAYVWVNSEALALYNRDNTIAPNNTRKALIDGVFTAIKSGATSGSNILAKCDVIQVHAAASQSSSLLNWVSTSFTASVGGGAPVFVTDRGWFVNGIADFMDIGCAPSGLTQYAQNTASYGGWMRTPLGASRTNSILGTQTTTACTLNPRTSSNLIGTRINGTTADATVASTDYYGFTVATRLSSSQIVTGKNGVLGTAQSSTSAARSAINFGFGKANSTFAEGQISAFFAGTALSAAEELDLYNALGTYMAGVGVVALVPTTRTLSQASTTKLPDGTLPPVVGKGMACTALVLRTDGQWYVGNGIATAQAILFSRLSSDFLTQNAEFTTATVINPGTGLPLGVTFNGSIQGGCVDASDGSMWFVDKIANSGATTYLLHWDPVTETLISAPVALPTISCNGIADDGVAGTLLITQDISSAVGGMIRVNKSDGSNTNAYALATPGDTDQMFAVTITSGNFFSGDVLVSSGANGVSGFVNVMRKDDYGAYCSRRVDTVTNTLAIEGIVLNGSTYYLTSDQSTHNSGNGNNQVTTYAA